MPPRAWKSNRSSPAASSLLNSRWLSRLPASQLNEKLLRFLKAIWRGQASKRASGYFCDHQEAAVECKQNYTTLLSLCLRLK